VRFLNYQHKEKTPLRSTSSKDDPSSSSSSEPSDDKYARMSASGTTEVPDRSNAPRLTMKIPEPRQFSESGKDMDPGTLDRWYEDVREYLLLHGITSTTGGNARYYGFYTEGRAKDTYRQALEEFGENEITRDQLIGYLQKRFQSSRHTEELYQKFLEVGQVKDGIVTNISDVATDLLTYRSKLPKDTISDYVFMQRFFASMHIKLRQIIEPWFDNEETINSGIRYAERQDAMLRRVGAYKKESKEKSHHKDRGHSNPKPTYQKKVSNTVSKERKASGDCFTCGNIGHLSCTCPDKKDEGKEKAVNQESTSNRAEAETSADEVYINSMEIETYASSGQTAPSTAKAKKALEGTIRIKGHDVRVLVDTGTIGEDILSAAFVTTHGVETKALEGELWSLMAMKGSQTTSNKQCVVDIEIGKMRTRNNRMIVGNLAKYDALIRIEFLSRNQATIECVNSMILFSKHKINVNCTPTSGLVRAAAIGTTEEVMEMFPEVFPDPIAERLPPLREYNHRIQLKDKENLKTQPTFGVPAKWELKLKEWLAQKEREGVIYRKEVPGTAPLFVQGKTDGRIRLLVDLTARNDNRRKDDIQIPNQRTILNALGRSRYRSKIDLSDTYFQTKVEPEYEYLNCFKTFFGGFVC